MAGVVLRRATVDDIAVLSRWDEMPHVVAAVGTAGSIDWAREIPRRVTWRELLVAEVDARPVGFVQIIDPRAEETHYWGEVGPHHRAIDIWIGEERDLGRGYGTVMMGLALQRCFADPSVISVLIDPLTSNTRAHRFYRRLGFVPVERRTFGDDDCLVHELTRERRREVAG